MGEVLWADPQALGRETRGDGAWAGTDLEKVETLAREHGSRGGSGLQRAAMELVLA